MVGRERGYGTGRRTAGLTGLRRQAAGSRELQEAMQRWREAPPFHCYEAGSQGLQAHADVLGQPWLVATAPTAAAAAQQ